VLDLHPRISDLPSALGRQALVHPSYSDEYLRLVGPGQSSRSSAPSMVIPQGNEPRCSS